MAIILVLAGLILATSGYVQKKGARSRAEAEIAAISAALENYKADNGIYPRGNADLTNTTTPYDTDKLDARSNSDPTAAVYFAASLFLYEQLAGISNGIRSSTPSGKTYFTFKPNMLLPPPPSTADITAIRDPFGNSYGYSTAFQGNPTKGYNPTFDLWSTVNEPNQASWIKNW